MHAVDHILWYIKGTVFHGITFYRDFSLHLLAYPNIDWVVNVSTDALSFVIVFFLDEPCWLIAKKQTVVSQSSAEFKYHAFTYVVTNV